MEILKVVCINNKNFEESLTVGKEYEVESIFKNFYTLKNNDIKDVETPYYKKERFKIVEITQEEQTITKDDKIEAKKPNTYKLSEIIKMIEDGELVDGDVVSYKRDHLEYKITIQKDNEWKTYKFINSFGGESDILFEFFGEEIYITKKPIQTYDVITMLQMLKENNELEFEDEHKICKIYIDNSNEVCTLDYDFGNNDNFNVYSLDEKFILKYSK